MRRAYSDEKDSNKKKETSNKLEKISTENSQSLEVHCAEFNEKNPSPLEFSFDLFGEEPFWNAELRASSLTYTIPNDETNQFNTDSTYIWFWGTSGETLIFTGESHEKLIRKIVLIADSVTSMNTRQKFVSEPQYLRVVLIRWIIFL